MKVEVQQGLVRLDSVQSHSNGEQEYQVERQTEVCYSKLNLRGSRAECKGSRTQFEEREHKRVFSRDGFCLAGLVQQIEEPVKAGLQQAS
jgi:hypothetical protein